MAATVPTDSPPGSVTAAAGAVGGIRRFRTFRDPPPAGDHVIGGAWSPPPPAPPAAGPPNLLTNPSFESPLTPLPGGGWGPYDDPLFGLALTPCDIFAQDPVWFTDGAESLHFKTRTPNPGSETQAINPTTYTGSPARPSGWWPANAGESYGFMCDILGIHQADYVLDAQGVFLELDFWDAAIGDLGFVSSPQSPNEIHAVDGGPAALGFNVAMVNPYGYNGNVRYRPGATMDSSDTFARITAPAGAAWVVPYIGTINGSDYVEAKVDNAWFGRTDTAVYSATGLPSGITIHPISGQLNGTITDPIGTTGTATITLTVGPGIAPQMIYKWNVS